MRRPRQPRPVLVSAPVPKPPPKPKTPDILDKLIAGVKSISSKPTLIVLLIVSALVAYDVSHVDKLGSYLASKPATAAIGEWVNDNKARVGGVIISFPAIYMFPTKNRVLAAFVVFLLLMVLPPVDFFYYLVGTLATVLYFQVPDSTVRLLILGFGAFWFFLSANAGTLPTPAPPTGNTSRNF